MLDVVVRGDGSPRDRRAIDDSQQRQHDAGFVVTGQGALGVDVGAGRHLAVHNHEQDEEDSPGVLLVLEDGAQTTEVEGGAADGDDNDANNGAQFPVRHGRQRGASRDGADGAPPNLRNDIQSRQDLRRVPAEAVPGDGHLPEARAGPEGRAPAGDGGAQEGAEDGDGDGLTQVEAKLPPQEPGGQARDVHSGTGPQQGHGRLLVPRLRPLILRAHSLDRLGLDAQLGVHGRLEREQPVQHAGAAAAHGLGARVGGPRGHAVELLLLVVS